jgi:PfaB family protein
MDLIVSGMALSYQWWPSIVHFEESLAGKRNLSPAMVEQAGEVIYQAVSESRPGPGSKLSIIYNPDQIDLGHYLSLLKKIFISVDQVKPASISMYSKIRQAADIIQYDNQRQVVICEMSSSGSAAVVLSSDNKGAADVRLKFAEFPGLEPSRADYVVLSEAAASNQAPTATLLRGLFQDRVNDFPAALGCSSAASALSSEIVTIIQAVLSIRNRLIPACKSNNDLLGSELQGSPLYPIKDFRPWLSHGPDYIRSALLIFQESGSDDPAYIILEETDHPEQPPTIRIVSDSDPLLFPISGNNEGEILDKLLSLERLSATSESLISISNIAYAQYYFSADKFVLSLLAGDRDQLLKELAHAKTGVLKVFQSGKNWASPNGSYFTANPLGSEGVAFVYPGAFNSYPIMGRDLFFSFPELQDAASQDMPNLSHSLADEFLYLRSSKPDPESDPDRIMADFYQHPNQLIESGISLSVLHTLILDQLFDIRPNAALGYSLGEISMLWANRIWQNSKDSSEIWSRSQLFKDELFGEMKAVRSYWRDKNLADDFWRSYILKADRELAKSACAQEEMAFLSIVNTQDEVVIVGEAEACKRVIDRLDCRSLPMPFNAVIHNPTMQSTYQSFVDLYNISTVPRADINFYSTSEYQKLALTGTELAENMAKMTCNPVDFPRLVNQVYNDGARIFIEVGPQKTCSRWIDKILQDQPHAAIAINKRYQPDLHGVLKVIALLLSHRVDINLSLLYPAVVDAENKNIPPLNPLVRESEKPNPELNLKVLDTMPEPLIRSYFENMDLISADLAQSHQDFLKNQQTLTRNLARLMHIQAGSPPDAAFINVEEALYTKSQIQAFTSGDHRICFGSTFSGFGDRRIPRLPNGDLQFIDRVIQIEGQPEQIVEGSTLISEFDLPDQAWYKNGSLSALPHVSIMEMALQTCGFLSAYMGSIKGRESQDLYFRNLDGEGTLLSWPTSPTKTITNHVRLLSSSALEDVIIQNYAFELSWGGQTFYQGTSSFGYFPLPMLENQSGLDVGQTNRTWQEENPGSGSWLRTLSSKTNEESWSEARLPDIDEIWISPSGGRFSSGYLYSRIPINNNAWFYQAHFYQDPVMPGSLGVETMAQALIKSASAWDLPENLKWRSKAGGKINWKYRGQITPDIKEFEIELHIKNISQTSEGVEISADGILWKDSKPIYKVENISLETY